jgi:2-oxoglutarate ferredoxin oxidoreductase subunit gamma
MNIVMVGFFAAITKLVSREALRKAVAESVPEHFRDLNLKAFDKGYDHGVKQLEGAETVAAKA